MQRVWPALSSSLKPRRNFHIKVCQEVGISASCLPTIKSNSEIYGYVKNAGCSDCFRTIQHGCEHRKHSIYLYMIYTKASSLLFRLHSERNFLAAFSTPCLLSLLSLPFSIAGAMPWRLANQWRVGWPACGSTWACLPGRGHVKKHLWYRRIYISFSCQVSSPVRSVKCGFVHFSCLAHSFVSIRSIYWGRKVWKCQAASCFSTLDLTQYHRSTVSWQLLGTNSAPRQRSVLQSCSLPWKHDER